MKPPFALTLSFDGLQLLHRSAGGWRSVGAVSLDTPDLQQAMSDLRQQAERLEPDGVYCKLILPNDQIRYMTLETGPVDDDTRHQIARRMLNGATPYPVDDLVSDISPDGDKTHVAAVAKDTLAEAEAFAVEHGLQPVSFVAVPADMPFLGEPFFGPTAGAAGLLDPGDTVEADGIAVVIVGVSEIPEPDPAPQPVLAQPEPEQPAAPVESASADEAEAHGPEPSDAPILETSDGPVFRSRARSTPNNTTDPAIGFASRRNGAGSKSQATTPSEPRPEPQVSAPKPPPAPARPAKPAGSKPRILRAVPPDPAPSPPEAQPGTKPTAPPEPDLAASLRVNDPAPEPDHGPDLAPEPGPEPRKRDGFLSRRKPRKAVEPPVKRVPDPIRVAAAAPPSAATLSDQSDDEAQRMTVFGARKQARRRGKPRHLGLVLTAILLFFLAGVAVWAALFVEGNGPTLWSMNRDTDLAAEPEIDETGVDNTTIVEALGSEGPLAAEPEPLASGPEMAMLPEATDPAPGLSDTDAAVLDALAPETGSETILETETGTEPVDTADLETQYAVTGIWPRAPDAPSMPEPQLIENLFVAAVDPDVPLPDAVALPDPAGLDTDGILASVSSPVAAGTAFELGADGLVIPTPDGALSPDGHLVYLGRPPAVPPQTPTRFEEAPDTDILIERLAAFRPTARPSDLAEQNERARLGGLTRSELGRMRPVLRPPAPKEKLEVDETPTARAVAQSPKPTLRPKDLAQRTTVARTNNPSTATRITAVKPKTVSPSVPSSASVARQATLKNAINLNRVNLIGVYGTPSNRRALVRLPNGRYKKVKIGDSLDGGRVVAIGDTELNYRKGTRTMSLKMPRG